MNENIHNFVINYSYILPTTFIISALWFKAQQYSSKKKDSMDNKFILRNSFYVVLFVLFIIYFAKSQIIDENIMVNPADF